MKKFRLLSLILALLMIITVFVGCGSTSNSDAKSTKNDTDVSGNGALDLDEIINDDGEKFLINATTSGEIKKGADDISGNQFELQGHTYSFPIKMSELFDNGWSLSSGYNYQTEFEGNSTTNLVSYFLVHKDGMEICLRQMTNDSSESKEIQDCYLTGFEIDNYTLKEGSDFVIPGGITRNSNARDVLSVFGNPNKTKSFKGHSYNSDDQLTYSKHSISNIGYTFTFDDEDGSIYSVAVKYEK